VDRLLSLLDDPLVRLLPYSSGVANHIFYVLSADSGSKTINGVTYNSPTYEDSTVTGIGRAKAPQN
jgi:hypothetical protein